MATTTKILRKRPHPGQQHILQNKRRYNVVNCGRRFGKTVLGIEPVLEALTAGKNAHWFAPTYKILLDAWYIFSRLLKPIAKTVSKTDKRIELRNGAVLEFWSLEDPDAGRSREGAVAIVDEAAMVLRLHDVINKVLRPILTKVQGSIWFLSTPRGKNDFYDLFQRGLDDKNADWTSFKAPTWANPHLPAEEEGQVLADIEAGIMPQSDYNQEYLAEFLDESGALFKPSYFKNIIDPYDLPMGLHWMRGWDMALSEKQEADETVGVKIATDDAGNIYLDDMRSWRKEFPDSRDEIIELMVDDGPEVAVGIERPLAGLPVIQELLREKRLLKHRIYKIEVKGKSKKVRAQVWASRAEAGKLFLVRGDWNRGFIDQCLMFRGHPKDSDDRIDAVSVAMDLLFKVSTQTHAKRSVKPGTREYYDALRKDQSPDHKRRPGRLGGFVARERERERSAGRW